MREFRILEGDALAVLRTLPDESVNCCVTSPPYWGLRDYGTGRWEGGNPACQHRVGGQVQDTKAPGAITTGQRPGADASACRLCGARRIDSQIGLEATPTAYVSRMVEVFREVRRALRDDGTLWLNLGDSYSAHPGQRKDTDKAGAKQQTKRGSTSCPSNCVDGLKPKDLVGIPWRVAFALQSDGWYLRSDIIWAKPNPMPESVTDRPTKAHEYLFLLSKSERYFYNHEAIQEPSVTNDPRRPYGSQGAWDLDGRPEEQRHGGEPRSFKGSKFNAGKTATHQLGRASDKPRIPKQDQLEKRTYTGFNERWDAAEASGARMEFRNRRSVWTVATQPYPEAHFATFPPDLIKPCILAGCPQSGTVLDPFAGSGTTLEVATELGCIGIGIELNPAYCRLIEKRLRQDVLDLGGVAV